MNVIVTGGAGFIGSNLIRYILSETSWNVLNIDKLTYAGHKVSLSDVEQNERYQFANTDICNSFEVEKLLSSFQPDYIMHLAAESHVDRSIDGAGDFIKTNIVGTYTLLDIARKYFRTLSDSRKNNFRFLHVSTDEVYGTLGETGLFKESTPYDPRSPYSASKASSDHLVMAWFHTYNLPVLITNCSNNYGPYQFPEKLIPVVILKSMFGDQIPIYGKGDNVRDWLYVEDHAQALLTVLQRGRLGETYNIGGNNERKNIEIVDRVCELLDELKPRIDGLSYKTQKTYVKDRPGHDKRYAIDASKIKSELGWEPMETFESGFRKTVKWYLENLEWCNEVTNSNYDLGRIGLGGNE